MILHIPHTSTNLNGYIELTNEKENLLSLTDTYVEDIFDLEYQQVKFEYSRFVCDVERFKTNESMDKVGQGVIYTKDCFGNNIKRNISDEETYNLYDEHHRKLNLSVNKSLSLFKKVVIVDCHSFTSKSENDPDICLGIDPFHTSIELIEILYRHFRENNLTVMVNQPFSGTMVSSNHYLKNKDVESIMIELNKSICINKNIKEIIQTGLQKVDEYEWSFE